MENEKEIKYFSMFTGVGGFELGLQGDWCSQSESGRSKEDLFSRGDKPSSKTFKCVGFSEIDKYANELLKNKFPEVKNYGDATKINPRELPEFDMLCGGFPCQAFSIAGKRGGFQDIRGTMFFEIARILEVKRPKIVLLENVKGLLNHNKGETFKVIIQTMEELGYRTQWMVLNSKFFGVPQNRERVFIIGCLRGQPRPEILPFRNTMREGHEGSERQTIGCINSGEGKIQNSNTFMIMDLYNKKEHSERSPALTEPHHNTIRVRENMKIRRLTPIECERLQGFPDNWTGGFSDTQRYKMMGNAVTVNVIKAIGENLK